MITSSCNFRDNPKLGDGNLMTPRDSVGGQTNFRDNPKLGDGNPSSKYSTSPALFNFRDNPKLGDGNVKAVTVAVLRIYTFQR